MRVTIAELQRMKDRHERIAMLTAYDYTSGQILDAAGVPLLLVGDTVGMVELGYDTTIPVTVDDIVHHARAVARGAKRPLIVADMPFMAYATPEQALTNATRLLQQGNAQAVKLEGGALYVDTVRRLVASGIPVMGHLGYTPQSINQIGVRVQGKTSEAARRMLGDALALQEAGAFAIVLELVPAQLAAAITERLRIPTIGIGAGAGCSGQVQVLHDMLGLYTDFFPRHAKRYLNLAELINDAVRQYVAEVQAGSFPTPAHGSTMDEAVLRQALEE